MRKSLVELENGRIFLDYKTKNNFQKDFFVKLIQKKYNVKFDQGFLIIEYPYKDFRWND